MVTPLFPSSRGWAQTQPQLQGGSCLGQIHVCTIKSVPHLGH